MGFFLGIDLGTSYFKAGLFDKTGKIRGLGHQFVKKESENNTICELNLNVFWNTLHSCVSEALHGAGIFPGEITAVSYSSQANSFILLDGNDVPLTPFILWPDNRAEKTDARIEALGSRVDFNRITGLGITPGGQFTISKINWFRKIRPEIWGRVKSILSISDFLTFSLSGQKLSDASTSAMTGLLDITKCQWWDKSLEILDLDSSCLPVPKRTGTYAGQLTDDGAELIGLTSGIPYFLGGLDHHCAAIGSGLTQNANLCESTGTVLSCVAYSDDYSPKPDIFLAPGLSEKHYFRMAFDDNGAHSLEWYQNMYASDLSIPELLEMAKEVEPGCLGLVAQPFACRYDDLEGFLNIRPVHKHGHFVRAILESTAMSLKDLTGIIKKPGFQGAIVSTGGGAQSSLWVKIKADILETDFYIPNSHETACMGAAMIGAAGSEELGDWNEIVKEWVKFKEIVKPSLKNNN